MDIISIVALGVGVVALGVPFMIEAVRRPRLAIASAEWRNPVFVPWTFATVRVYNKPVGAMLRNTLTRQSAHGCRAEIDYYLWDSTARFLTVPGRWSSLPEPLRFVPTSEVTRPRLPGGGTVGDTIYPAVTAPVSGGTAPTNFSFGPPVSGEPASPIILGGGETRQQSAYTAVYDPSRDSGRCDIAVSDEGEQIAVAILKDGKAFAFSTESYKYHGWENPDW